MSEINDNYNWDEVNLDGFGETVSEADINLAKAEKVPGSFVVLFGKPTLTDRVSKDFTDKKTGKLTKGYMSFEVGLNMTVLDVVALDKPVIGGDGKPLTRDGVVATRIRPLTETEKAADIILYEGMALGESVRMVPQDPTEEKIGTKNRRIKIADAIGIVEPGKELTIRDWMKVEGKKCIVNQVWNTWKDRDTGDIKKNIKIDYFNGFEPYVEKDNGEAKEVNDEDFDDI